MMYTQHSPERASGDSLGPQGPIEMVKQPFHQTPAQEIARLRDAERMELINRINRTLAEAQVISFDAKPNLPVISTGTKSAGEEVMPLFSNPNPSNYQAPTGLTAPTYENLFSDF